MATSGKGAEGIDTAARAMAKEAAARVQAEQRKRAQTEASPDRRP